MAVDKLVDSTKLDACLDAEADAIRAKTGGSADIPFDFANNKGFADAIAAIPSGGGSGETLLESGTFTYAGSSDIAMHIPVTFSGTATRAFVTAREIPSGQARTLRWLNGNLTFVDTAGVFTPTTITRKVAANGNQTYDANSSLVIENGEIVCRAATGSYNPAPVTYDWFVWGYTT